MKHADATDSRPSALYVWLVRSEEVQEQPGIWRIRKWDTEPFPEANFAVSETRVPDLLPGLHEAKRVASMRSDAYEAVLDRIAELEATPSATRRVEDPHAKFAYGTREEPHDKNERIEQLEDELQLAVGQRDWAFKQLRATPSATPMPKSNDGREQTEFELWAKRQGYDMQTHPLHWLFLDKRTYAAREGWRSALEYVEKVMCDGYVHSPVREKS